MKIKIITGRLGKSIYVNNLVAEMNLKSVSDGLKGSDSTKHAIKVFYPLDHLILLSLCACLGLSFIKEDYGSIVIEEANSVKESAIRFIVDELNETVNDSFILYLVMQEIPDWILSYGIDVEVIDVYRDFDKQGLTNNNKEEEES